MIIFSQQQEYEPPTFNFLLVCWGVGGGFTKNQWMFWGGCFCPRPPEPLETPLLISYKYKNNLLPLYSQGSSRFYGFFKEQNNFNEYEGILRQKRILGWIFPLQTSLLSPSFWLKVIFPEARGATMMGNMTKLNMSRKMTRLSMTRKRRKEKYDRIPVPNIPVGFKADMIGTHSERGIAGLPPPSHSSSLTLYQVDVPPPQFHGAQPFLAVVPQPPQVPAGVPPQLAPTAELSSLGQTQGSKRSDTILAGFYILLFKLSSNSSSIMCPALILSSPVGTAFWWSLPHLSVRFSAMGLASSRMGFNSVWLFCFSSCLLTVFAPNFPLPEELSRDLELLRLTPPADDFLRYSRDW